MNAAYVVCQVAVCELQRQQRVWRLTLNAAYGHASMPTKMVVPGRRAVGGVIVVEAVPHFRRDCRALLLVRIVDALFRVRVKTCSAHAVQRDSAGASRGPATMAAALRSRMLLDKTNARGASAAFEAMLKSNTMMKAHRGKQALMLHCRCLAIFIKSMDIQTGAGDFSGIGSALRHRQR